MDIIMAISNVWIEDGCIACGTCEAVCPEVFYVTDQAEIKANVDFSVYEAGIIEAADSCPVSVIKYE